MLASCVATLGARAVPCACLRPLRKPQPQRSRSLVLQATAQPATGGEAARGRGGSGGQPRRERVAFADPRGSTLTAVHVTQRDLDSLLSKLNALGFELEGGELSQRLEDLPEGGTVTLVLPEEPPLATQVRPGAACSCCP